MHQMLSFESPDCEKEFPGLYASQGDEDLSEDDDRHRKKESGKKKESKKGNKDKGYVMFEEEDSEEELVLTDDVRSPSKMKKHSKPSFKLIKKDKIYKPKEKDKEKKDKKEKEKEEDGKKDVLKWKKRKAVTGSKEDLEIPPVNVVPIVPENPRAVFGVPLAIAVERSKLHDGIPLPAVFRDCIDYIEEVGLTCEGIYRMSGVKSKVQLLRDTYNMGEPVNLAHYEPNIVASLLKLFLRELPEPVLTNHLSNAFEQAAASKLAKQTIEQFQQLIEELPTANKCLLSWVIIHFTHVISRESQNKMSLQNVSIVLSPTMQISHKVLGIFFNHSRVLFRETVLKRYVPPLRPAHSRWSLELPENPQALEEELKKQESLLNQLHEVVARSNDPAKEEQLWEVQRVVTQLKRKIKQARNKEREKEIASERHAKLHKEVQEKIQDLVKSASRDNLAQDTDAKPPTPPSESQDKKEDEEEESEQSEETQPKSDRRKSTEEDKEAGNSDQEDEKTEQAGETNSERKQSDGAVTEETVDNTARRSSHAKATSHSRSESPNGVVDADEPDFEKTEAASKDAEMLEPEEVSDEDVFLDEERDELEEELESLLIEQEELVALGDELRSKLSQEQTEIGKLKDSIAQLETEESKEEDLPNSSDDNEDEDEIFRILQQLSKTNAQLERDNQELCDKIDQERQMCVDIRVQIRLVQTRPPIGAQA